MRHAKLTLVSTLMLGTMFTAGSALGMSVGNLPPEKTQGAIHYGTGGIGQDEVIAMKQAESQYPLSLELVQGAVPSNKYLAGVDVRIKDHVGKTVLNATSDGPFLLAKLPPGNYTAMAEENGRPRRNMSS